MLSNAWKMSDHVHWNRALILKAVHCSLTHTHARAGSKGDEKQTVCVISHTLFPIGWKESRDSRTRFQLACVVAQKNEYPGG